MKKLARCVLAVLAVIFVVSGITMMVQASATKADVKAGISSEKITLGTAIGNDGTTDEVVAAIVPKEFHGKALDAPGALPESLRWQADVILGHAIGATGGLRYAEMPREIPALDEDGNHILDENDEPVMTKNYARDIWIISTMLRTALMQGYMAWKLSDLIMSLGALFVLQGLGFGLIAFKNKA